MVLFVITSVPEPVPFLLTRTFCFSCFSILEPLAATLPVIYFLKSWGKGGGGGCYFFRLVQGGVSKKILMTVVGGCGKMMLI